MLKDGLPVEGNAAKCPATMAALGGAPQPDQPGRTPAAMFSLLKPRTRIPPHVGVSNARLVAHLPLIIPPGCGFRVGNQTRQWVPGQAWVFDDTRVGIPEPACRIDDYPFALSGGQKQRVMIAMTLVSEPDYLIADEPITALDVTIQAQILYLLRDLQCERGQSFLFITHNIGVVEYVADEVAAMQAGRIVESGPSAAVLGAPQQSYTRTLLAAVPRVGARA